MTRFYVQREAGIRERATALAIAVGVGGLSFYLARMLLAREDLESKAPAQVTRGAARRSLAESQGSEGR